MAIKIAQVQQGGGSYAKTTELRQYPFIICEIDRIDPDAKGKGFKGKDTAIAYGSFIGLDAGFNPVFEKRHAEWDCGVTIIKSFVGHQLPATFVVSISKIAKQNGAGDVNVLNNVGGKDLDKVVEFLEAREAELLAAMDDAPGFDD